MKIYLILDKEDCRLKYVCERHLVDMQLLVTAIYEATGKECDCCQRELGVCHAN